MSQISMASSTQATAGEAFRKDSAYNGTAGHEGSRPSSIASLANINPLEWHPQYMACLEYFVNHSQHTPLVQSIVAFINIRLPCQRRQPVLQLPHLSQEARLAMQGGPSNSYPFVSLRPYIRRLIVTGRDSASMMQVFFGENWVGGIGPIRQQERVNYLFTAKSSGWASTKAAYDILPDEQTPFLRPLEQPLEEEIRLAEAKWSEWLAMEDWMVGPRSPW
ncbi:hypothetical protein MAP00_008355 [Monascus purpureus]|nr:hypothetical protein MAP00_008355 [Monascus purpureus]